MSMEELSARMAALQQRVSELEGSESVDGAAGSSPDLYHDRFESRPPPKSHTTDLAACQRDSMLRMLTTTVVACEQKPKAEATGGKKKKKKGSSAVQPDMWLVQLEDTVLFPEGGGQPADTGTIAVAGGENEPVRVSHVYRTPDGVVMHEASAALSVGASVVVTLDWDRRFDHMQCHSAQHLISALALRSGTITPGRPEHQIKTHSWELGSSSVVVELEVDSTTPEGEAAISEIEEATNAAVRSAVPIIWHEYTRDQLENSPAGMRVSAKSLPPEVKTVRLVEIQGVDLNPCCGTHVPTTAALQMIKFLKAEPVKGGKTLLHFGAGTRLLTALAEASLRDRGLNKVLCCKPEEYVDKVTKISGDSVAASRAAKKANEELAGLIGAKLAGEAVGGVVTLHRTDADMVFLQTVAGAVNAATAADGKPPLVMLLSCGVCTKKGGEGKFLVVSNGCTDPIHKDVAAALGGRGGGKGGTMQGKSASLTPEKIEEAAGLLRTVATAA